MKDAAKKKHGRTRKAARRSRLLIWIGVAAVSAALVYGVSQLSSIAYTEKDLGVVDFSSLDAKQTRTALEAANRARCTCGCGLTLAGCVATDSTCPIRTGNIDRIKVMVEQAKSTRPTS